MSIPVTCPHCSHVFAVPDNFAGRRGKCKKCQKVITVPKVADVPTVKVASVASVLPTRKPAGDPSRQLPAAAPVDPLVVAAPTSQAERQASRRKSNAPLFAVIGIVLAVVVVGIVGFVLFGGDPDGSVATAPDENPDATTDPADTPAVTPTDGAPPPPPASNGAKLEEIWTGVSRALVKVEATGDDGKTTGLGVVVDDRGWILTNWHLIENATTVRVELWKNAEETSKHIIDGAIAIRPDLDLAVLLVEGSSLDPIDYQPITIKADVTPHVTDKVFVCYDALGDRQIRPGSIERVQRTESLPPAARGILRDRRINDESNLMWIQHQPNVTADMTGASLLNDNGELIGLVTRMHDDSRSGFAVHAMHIGKAIEAADGDVIEWEAEALAAATDNPVVNEPIDIDIPDQPNIPDEVEPVDPNQPKWLSKTTFEEMQEECEEFDWKPTTQIEYNKLQRLAERATLAKQNAETGEYGTPSQRSASSLAVDKVLNELSGLAWEDNARIEFVNQFVEKGLEDTGQGVFAYAKVILWSEPNFAVLEVIGNKQVLVLPVKTTREDMPIDSRWLVLGIHDPTFNFNLTINGQSANTATVNAMYVVGE